MSVYPGKPDEYQLFSKAFPDLAGDIIQALGQQGEEHLVNQVGRLKIYDRCRCGDDFCSTIYTRSRSRISNAPDHRNVALNASTGMIILDVVEEQIGCIEILFRPEVRRNLLALLPD